MQEIRGRPKRLCPCFLEDFMAMKNTGRHSSEGEKVKFLEKNNLDKILFF
jgi:hypothetical protein